MIAYLRSFFSGLVTSDLVIYFIGLIPVVTSGSQGIRKMSFHLSFLILYAFGRTP
jgi:hypothetical protein